MMASDAHGHVGISSDARVRPGWLTDALLVIVGASALGLLLAIG